MWQHEIVRDLLSVSHLYKKDSQKVISLALLIKESKTFYFGLRSSMNNARREPELYSSNGNFTFPYDTCLFETVEDIETSEQKKAQLVWSHENKWYFAFFVSAFIGSKKEKTKWVMPLPIVSMEPLEKPDWHSENKNIVNISDKVFLGYHTGDYDKSCNMYFTNGHGDVVDVACDEAANTLLMLSLLNCKNIITKTIVPPERLNKKRISRHKEPFLEYKVLEIVKGVPKEKDAGTEDWGYVSPIQTAFHMCRGHFKTYTEDAPLFGKYTGTFWWQPQARGSKENGEIVKDYVVKTEGAQA